MDRRALKGWLEAGLSLTQIGALTNRDPSTVGYWIQKHGLIANGREKYAGRGGLARAELTDLVERGLSIRRISERLQRSPSTVRYWIKRYELEPLGSNRRSDIERAVAAGRRTLLRECRRHGWTLFVIENSGHARCRACRIERVAEWRRRTKAKLIEEAGGRCRLCGYDRCQAALQFHHLDPAQKSFALSLRGATRAIGELRAEAAKCELLCANCHAEVEVGFSTIQS